MGEEFEYGKFLMIRDDGTYVPFDDITEIDLNDIPSDAVYDPIVPIANEPITITFDMKRRDHRKMLKNFKKQVNAMSRRVRYSKRQKERARRKKLKQ